MRVQVSTIVEGVDPKAAARWWSDFREGRVDHGFIPGHRRRIVSRDADKVVMEEETKILGLRVFKERTTAWPDELEVRFAGTNNFAHFDGAYTFDAAEGGTRIGLDATVTLHRPLEWTDVAAKHVVAAILRADLRLHAKEMRSDLSGGRRNASRRRA